MLADALTAIVSQQLLPSADGSGRVAAFEILLGSAALAAMIREDKTDQVASLMQAGAAVGMQTMDTALERLYQRGLVTAEDAVDRMLDKDAFQKKALTRRTAPIT
jgi:twitching motility protein PilT